jgi:hypothetical protein
MAQRVLFQAVMEDGTIIRDEACTFEAFTGLALGFRRDSDVARLTWTVLLETPPAPAPGTIRTTSTSSWPRRTTSGGCRTPSRDSACGVSCEVST